jgi:hypothetical protein
MTLPRSLREGVIAWMPDQEPRSALELGDLLGQLSRELSLEPERIRLWTLARAVETALWCYEIGEDAADDLALAAALI